MANTVIALKKSATPSAAPTSLANGELAINYADGKLYYKHANGTILSFSSGGDAFATVNANNTLVVADSPSDILTLEPGNNISIVGDAVNDKITIGLKNDVSLSGTLTLGAIGGDEGGELRLANAVTNSLLTGDVVVDVYQSKLRFYESAGTNRGAFIDLSIAGAGVSSNLLAGGTGASDTTARDWAASAFLQANTARTHANAAHLTANAAFDKANSTTYTSNVVISVADNTNAALRITQTGSAFAIRVEDDTNPDASPFVIDANGNVGIGTTSPTELLHLASTGNVRIILEADTDNTNELDSPQILFYQDNRFNKTRVGYRTSSTANDFEITNETVADSANLVLGTGNQTRVHITNVGNVGIATTNPQYRLDINGSVNASAFLVNGVSVVTDYSPAFNTANIAYAHANAAHLTANASFDQANTARVHANAAFLQANTALSTGQSAFNAANIAWATANGKFSSNGGTITGDVSIVGTLSISGNTILQNVTTLSIGDPLIYLAANNYVSDTVDIGFIANYVNATGSNVHTGLYREHEDKMYYLFRDYDREPANNHIGALSNNMTLAVLNADLRTSNILLAGANTVLWIRGSYEQANTARDHANNAFNKANNALANTSGITFGGVLNVSGNVTTQGLNVTSNVINFGTAMSILANGMIIINGDINMLG